MGQLQTKGYYLLRLFSKDVEANQKSGWGIIKDTDIVNIAKRNYVLVILDAKQYKTFNDSCSNYTPFDLKKHEGKPFFIIANQALCLIKRLDTR